VSASFEYWLAVAAVMRLRNLLYALPHFSFL
jgi:hypothetical protein